MVSGVGYVTPASILTGLSPPILWIVNWRLSGINLNARLQYIKLLLSFARLTQLVQRKQGLVISEIAVDASQKAFAQNV